MRINHNLAALNTYRQLNANTTNTARSLEKLSSGLRINKAGDDAAGLAISEKMRGQVRGLDQAARNAQDGISMIQTAEGGLNEIHSILQRMRELSVQASTDVLAVQDSTAIGDEMVSLRDEIDRIGNSTEFNSKKLLNGELSTKQDLTLDTLVGEAVLGTSATIATVDVSSAKSGSTFTISGAGDDITIENNGISQTITMSDTSFNQVDKKSLLNFDKLGIKINLNSTGATGTAADVSTALSGLTLTTVAGANTARISVGSNATAAEAIDIAFTDMRSAALNSSVGSLDNTSVTTVATAQAMTISIDSAVMNVSTQRGKIGAIQNRLEHSIANLGTSSENLTSAESRVRDVDMAKEMMEFTKNNILSQAAQAMLSQANQQPQGILQLLR